MKGKGRKIGTRGNKKRVSRWGKEKKDGKLEKRKIRENERKGGNQERVQ